MDQQKEIVFTYRQSEQAEAVVLRYERELPECMRPPAAAAEPRSFERTEAFRSAIAPPERKKSGWGTRLFVGVSLLAALVFLGVGIWYVGDYGWSLPDGGNTDPSGGGETRPPAEDRFFFDPDNPSGYMSAGTTITRYPTGGDARLELRSAQGLRELDPSDIYAKVNPSVVTVLGQQSQYASVGTGVIFHTEGYILTNYHVVAGCSACIVQVTGEYGAVGRYPAMLVGYDEDVDLAVLKIEARGGLTAAEFGVSDELAVGDAVYAIGNPLGMDLLSTFTNGIVSAINRDVDVQDVTMTLIQTNAALNSGNSGGPLINRYGQVVGVNTIKMMSEYDTIEGLGFAIPSSLAERWVNDLVTLGELSPQPVLGVTITRVPTVLPDGSLAVVQIRDVTPGGSGDRAGLLPGDYVVAFAGEEVTGTEQILAIRRGLYVGDEVAVRVYRGGEFLDLTMTMRAE